MRVLAGIFVMSLLLAIPSQVSGQEMTKEQVGKVEAEVLAFADAWVEVWGDNSCEKGAGLLHPDKLAFLYAGRFENHSEWMAACKESVAGREGYTGRWLETKVHVLTQDAAVFVGNLEQTFRNKDGTSRHYPMSGQTGLVERTPTGWVFTTFAFSNGSSDSGAGG